MVYRLDDHKLKESSIDPFVIAAQKDKDIVVHIVGDGDLKVVFEEKVKTAGLAAQFIFIPMCLMKSCLVFIRS